jgi:hypothetical protein
LLGLGEKVRPVCIGEFLMRIASSLSHKTIDRAKDERFFVRQIKGRYAANFGTGTKGGAEVVVHILNALVHAPNSRTIAILDDGQSAYNQTDRVNACNATTRQNPSTHRWINWCYGNAAMLLLGEGDTAIAMWGREGVLQGDPIAGRIHDTCLQGPIEEAVRRTATRYHDSNVHIIAFRDDVHVVGEVDAALFCYEQFRKLRKERTNVDTALDKVCAFVSPIACQGGAGDRAIERLDAEIHRIKEEGGVDMRTTGDAVVTEGFKAVGSPITATDSYASAFLDKAFDKYPSFIPRLLKMNAKAAIPLLRSTFLPVPTHLIRTTHPDIIQKHAILYDKLVFETYKNITQDPDLDYKNPKHIYNFSAPFSKGGVGFKSVEKTSPIAFYASVINATNVMRNVDKDLQVLVKHFKDPPQHLNIPHPPHIQKAMARGLPLLLIEAWRVAKRRVFDAAPSSFFPKTVIDLFHHLASEVINVEKLQHVLTAEAEEAWEKEGVKGMERVDVARTNAIAIRGASTLVSATNQTSSLHHLPAPAFRFALQLRTGTVRLPLSVCACGTCDMTIDHVLSCKKLRGRIIRHDVIVALLCTLYKAAGMVARTEVRVVNGTQKRMDVVVYTARRILWIDVSIVNPLCPSYVGDKDPLEARAKTKKAKWVGHAEEAGVVFMPFILNVFGGLGPSAHNVLHMIASQALINHPYSPAIAPGKWMGNHKAESTQRIAAALAFITHKTVEEAYVVAQGMKPVDIYKGARRYSKAT